MTHLKFGKYMGPEFTGTMQEPLGVNNQVPYIWDLTLKAD